MRKPAATHQFHYILFYKPYGALPQFSEEGDHKTLRDFGPFPKDVYAAGRLDADSEGLLFLTNDTGLNHRLTDPKFGHPRTYLVQVEGLPAEPVLDELRRGVVVQRKKTRPAEVRLLEQEPPVPPRTVPIRFRKTVPTSWLEITLREGRNRQVRRMTAAAGFPTLRLVRIKIGLLELGKLQPGQHRELSDEEVGKLKAALQTAAKQSSTADVQRKPRRSTTERRG